MFSKTQDPSCAQEVLRHQPKTVVNYGRNALRNSARRQNARAHTPRRGALAVHCAQPLTGWCMLLIERRTM